MAEYMTKRELRRRRTRFKIMGGFFDFIAILGSALLIVICITMLSQLFGWLKADLPQTFSGIGTSISEAIVQPEQDTAPQQ